MVDLYGAEVAQAIELALHTIRIGNMAGNTLDYVLYRISLGRWDVDRSPRRVRRGQAVRSVRP
jgi:hypothetical protein